MRKLSLIAVFILTTFLVAPVSVSAGWVSGHWKNGQYVNGYWRSDPNGLKYDNYSFDGDWSDAFNDSYYSPTKNYSSDWYTPSWITQNDYYIGKSFYDSRKNYSSYSYDLFDYDYDFWTDPIYTYKPSYNYGYNTYDFGSSLNSYKPYSSYNSLYGSTYTSPYSSTYSSPYKTYDSYSSGSYTSPYSNYSSPYDNSYDYYSDDYSSSESCYSLYCY